MPVASSLERQMLDLINQERTSRGLNPVQLELRLNSSAESHSKWMLQQDLFSHTGAGGSSSTERMTNAGFTFSGSWASAENIAWQSERGATGISDDVINLHNSLMNSLGHRANILNPNFIVVGIGIEQGDFGGYDAVVVTQNFARTSAPVQLDTGGPVPNPGLPTAGTDTLVLSFAGTLDGLGGNDRMTGSAGNDRLLGSDGNDTIIGGSGNDTIAGGNGFDQLSGRAGNDWMNGGAGNDLINGGTGNDTLFGSEGSDVFVFSTGKDVVRDFDEFNAAEDIDMRQALGITSFADLRANHMVQQGANVLIADAAGSSILIQNALISDLDASNFLF
jgi:serralysin